MHLILEIRSIGLRLAWRVHSGWTVLWMIVAFLLWQIPAVRAAWHAFIRIL